MNAPKLMNAIASFNALFHFVWQPPMFFPFLPLQTFLLTDQFAFQLTCLHISPLAHLLLPSNDDAFPM